MRLGQPGDVVDDLGAADLDPAMVAVGGLDPVLGQDRRTVEQHADVLEQGRPVALQGQHIVATIRRPDLEHVRRYAALRIDAAVPGKRGG